MINNGVYIRFTSSKEVVYALKNEIKKLRPEDWRHIPLIVENKKVMKNTVFLLYLGSVEKEQPSCI